MEKSNEIALQFLEKYYSWINFKDSNYKKDCEYNDRLLDKFLSIYSLEAIGKMNIDDYVVGKGGKSYE